MKTAITIMVLSLLLAFYSSSNGQTNFWAHHSLDFKINSLHKSVGGTFYAVSDTSILKSSDYGSSWEVIYSTPYPCYLWTTLFLYANKNSFPQDKLIVRQRNGSSGCTDVPPIISLDGGNNWKGLNTPGSFKDLAIDSFGDLYIVADSNLYKSSDDGSSWHTVNIPVDNQIEKLEIDTLNNLYISKSGYIILPPHYTFHWEDVYKSTNFGQDWDGILSTGTAPVAYYTSLFNISAGDLFCSLGYPSETQHYLNGTIKVYPIHAVSSAHITTQEIIFLATPSCCITQGIHVSIDKGYSWNAVNSGLSSLATSSIVSDTLGYLYTSTGDGIFKSNFTSYRFYSGSIVIMDDTRIGDTTFTEIKINNPFSFDILIDSIKSLSENFYIDDLESNIISSMDSINATLGFIPNVIGTFTSNINLYSEIIWARFPISGCSPSPILKTSPTTQLVFGEVNIDTFKTLTFKIYNDNSINDLVIDTIYIKEGIHYHLEDLLFPIVLETNDTTEIAVTFRPTQFGFLKDTLLMFSNSSSSLNEFSLWGVGQGATEVADTVNIPVIYALKQNYPNPFNPTTTITYQIPERAIVLLRVYDVLGNEVATLVNQEKPAGNYEIEFDTGNLPSGIYFYQLRAGSFVQTKKMLMIK